MRYRFVLFAGLLALMSNITLLAEQNKQAFSYEDYASVLKTHVDDMGMVDYKKLKTGSEKLEAFIVAMDRLDPNSFEKWDEKEKTAFWLNAYNAFTLKAIIDNYPIKSSFFKSMYYPRNSIRQIAGVWDELSFKVMGKDYTLEHIEHKILRKDFNEPRIHMALVCAAIGCPSLRNEPYTGGKIDQQLDDQSGLFVRDKNKFRIDTQKNVVYLSPILKWFADDFMEPGGTYIHSNPELSLKQIAVLEFISKYLNEKDRGYIFRKKFKIKYVKYDWSLNEER